MEEEGGALTAASDCRGDRKLRIFEASTTSECDCNNSVECIVCSLCTGFETWRKLLKVWNNRGKIMDAEKK